MIAAPAARELVLVGGGHAHLGVLRAFARQPPPVGTRVTLVAREASATYSGMLPGLIAGRFAAEECAVDLMRLARATGARFIQAEVTGLDLAAGLVLAEGRPPLHYDLLSLNCGAAPALVPGAAEHALPLRPFDRFLPGWEALLQRAAEAVRPLVLLVVGAGAAGVEVALALSRRLDATARVGLVAHGAEPLPHHAPAARRAVLRALAEWGVALHPGARVARMEAGVLVRADGERLGFDAAIWATGAAPPDWLAGSGLALCPRGFVAVDATLRSTGDPRVFAAGDVASVLPYPRERAGVFAVRQGPPLAGNLRRALTARPPRGFTPQWRYLALIATGTAAVATRGRLAASGKWALRLKDHIDRRWIGMHARMPAMPSAPQQAEAPMRCGGCGAKLPPAVLSRVLARLPRAAPAVAVPLGLATPDDAALLPPPAPGHLQVQSVDFFRAMVDDPWLFGRIAANHALGDIAAMGGTPRAALAIAGLPPMNEAAAEAELFAMLRGGQEVLEAAGAQLVGGHSAELAEAVLGFSVTGEVTPGQALRRAGLQPGDMLVLTKPLGTGVLLAGAMQGQVRSEWVEAAQAAMLASPFPAARVLLAHGATACADVTGFGLLNHLMEMLRASAVAAVLDPFIVPALPGALAALEAGIASTLHPANAAAAMPALQDGWDAVPAVRLALLLDPQTAGGLLAGVPADRAEACLAALRMAGCTAAAIIGTVGEGQPGIAVEPAAKAGVAAMGARKTPGNAERHRNHSVGPGKPVPAADRGWPRPDLPARARRGA